MQAYLDTIGEKAGKTMGRPDDERNGKKFAIAQPSAADRFDLGIKLKGEPAGGRFEEAGTWNAMVTHRVRITDPSQVEAEVLAWLARAYAAVK